MTVQVADWVDVVDDAVGVLIGHLVVPVGIEVEAGHASGLGLVMWWLCTRWSFMQVEVDWSMRYYKGLFVGWLDWLLR